MPSINLQIKYNLDNKLVVSAEDIRNNYLFGLSLERYGKKITDSTIEYYIGIAQKTVESLLQVKLVRQLVMNESSSFYGDDFQSWGYIKTRYPIVAPVKILGFIGSVKQVDYPTDWLSVSKPEDQTYSRILNLVPNSSGSVVSNGVYAGIQNARYIMGSHLIPNYWAVSYVTGFDPVPIDILQVISLMACNNILGVASDALLNSPGVSSSSISIDGLSQSTTTMANSAAGVFGARIKQYNDMLNGGGNNGIGLLKYLVDQYRGVPTITL